MAEPPVVRPDGGGRPSRRPAAGVRSVDAGTGRAAGERVRRQRRTTPLLAAREAAPIDHELQDREEPDRPLRGDHALPVQSALSQESRPAKKALAKNVPARKAPARKAPARKAPAKTAPAKKAPAKTAPARKAPAKNAPAKKAPAREALARTARAEATRRTPPKKVASTRAPVRSIDSAPRPVRERPAVAIEPPAARSSQSPVAGGRISLAAGVAAQLADVVLERIGVGRRPAEFDDALAAVIQYVARRLSAGYEVDDFGFDPEYTEAIWLGALRPLYRTWFRVEVRGIENIPATGGALVVANHSGTVPIDALMTAVAVHDEHPQHRFLRTLGADLLFQTPVLSTIARKSGSTLAANSDAERLLAEGEVVGVWPEGYKGIGKPFTERYKLQRFGRGGFVSAALATSAPIVPCSIVGAEEIYPILADVPALARLLGVPYVPITPLFPWLGLLGLIPLPSKWLIEFGTPVSTAEYGPSAADDPMLVFELTDQVRQTVQQTLYSLLIQRRSVFS